MNIIKFPLLGTIVFIASFTFVSSEGVCSLAKYFAEHCAVCNFLTFGQEMHTVKTGIVFGEDLTFAHACGVIGDSDSSEGYCCYNWHRKPYCCSQFGQIVNTGVWLIVAGIILVGIVAGIRCCCIDKASRRARAEYSFP